MHQRKAAFLLMVFFAPFLSDVHGVEPIGSASAAIDDCEGKVSPIVWNETISRHAEVPFYNSWDWFDDFGGGEDEGKRGGKGRSAAQDSPQTDTDASDAPQTSQRQLRLVTTVSERSELTSQALTEQQFVSKFKGWLVTNSFPLKQTSIL
jgi:hypothetical protein